MKKAILVLSGLFLSLFAWSQDKEPTASDFHFSVFAGFKSIALDLRHMYQNPREQQFTAFNAGGEIEWQPTKSIAVFFAASYEFTPEREFGEGIQTGPSPDFYYYEADLRSLNVFTGPRIYLFPDANLKMYGDIAMGVNVPFGSFSVSESGSQIPFAGPEELDLSPNLFASFGLGMSYKKRLALEFRGDTNKNMLASDSKLKMYYFSWGMALKYTL